MDREGGSSNLPLSAVHALLAQLAEAPSSKGGGSRFESEEGYGSAQSLMIGGPNSDEVTVYGASRTLLPTWFLVGQVFALKAHLVERRHGKAEAVGSNPTGGSW